MLLRGGSRSGATRATRTAATTVAVALATFTARRIARRCGRLLALLTRALLTRALLAGAGRARSLTTRALLTGALAGTTASGTIATATLTTATALATATTVARAARRLLAGLAKVLERLGLPVRATGSAIGHGMEPSFLANLAIAAGAVARGRLFAPLEPAEAAMEGPLAQALVTGWGHWRGESIALVAAA